MIPKYVWAAFQLSGNWIPIDFQFGIKEKKRELNGNSSKQTYKIMKKQLLIIAASLSLIPVGNLFAQQNKTFIKNTETVIAKNISHNNHNESFMESGDKKYSSKDYRGAITDYSKILLNNPNDYYALFQRALSKSYLNDHEGAIQDYTRAIQINSEKASAFYNRGLSKDKLKDSYGAISDFNKAIEIDPTYTSALHNRGKAKTYLEDYSGAITDFNKVISQKPLHLNARQNRANIHYFNGDYYFAILDINQLNILPLK